MTDQRTIKQRTPYCKKKNVYIYIYLLAGGLRRYLYQDDDINDSFIDDTTYIYDDDVNPYGHDHLNAGQFAGSLQEVIHGIFVLE